MAPLTCCDCGSAMAKNKGSRPQGEAMCRACRARLRSNGDRPCVDCGRALAGTRRNRCSPCSYRREKMANRESGIACSKDGCSLAARTKGLCTTHYAERHRLESGKTTRTYTRACEVCGTQFATTARAARACGAGCRAFIRSGIAASPSLAVTRWRHPARSRAFLVTESRGGVWTAGPCAECGAAFVSRGAARFCSSKCRDRSAWRRRYEARGEFAISSARRVALYERDGWSCQICGEPTSREYSATDPLAPTLDHIVPQSHMLVPDHSDSNLRLAHALCNAVRGDRVSA